MPPASQERAHHEEQRLDSIKEYIGYLSFLFSRDNPDLKEDIAQEAREAVIRRLRRDPDCPISHLKVVTKSTIINYRKRGSSIDGKLDESGRQRHYSFIDIDKVVTEDGSTLADTLTDPRLLPLRITEAQALHRVLINQLKDGLSDEENQALSLRLGGGSWREVGEVLGYTNGRVATIRDRIRTVARRVLPPFTEEQTTGRKYIEGGGRPKQREDDTKTTPP